MSRGAWDTLAIYLFGLAVGLIAGYVIWGVL